MSKETFLALVLYLHVKMFLETSAKALMMVFTT